MKYKVKNIEKQNNYQEQDYSKIKQAYILYIDYLNKAKNSEIMSGAVSEQFAYFIEYASKLTEFSDEIKSAISKDLTTFLLEVDTDQTYNGQKIVYQSSYHGMRDFTDKKLVELKNLCESEDYNTNFFNTAFNGLENTWYKLCNWFDSSIKEKIFHAKTSSKRYQEKMLQLNDVTFKILKNIFRNVNQTDERYAKNLNCSLESIQKLVAYLDELVLIMDNGSKDIYNFSFENYRSKLDELYNDLEQQLTKLHNIYTVTDEDLEIVIEEYDADFLQKQIDDLEAFISTIGLDDAIEIIFYNLDDAAKAQLGFDSYEDVLYEEDVLNYIAAIVDNDDNAFQVEKKYLDDFETFLKYIKKCGGNADDITAFLARLDKSESKYFSEVIDKVGISNALKILKYGQEGIDWLIELFKDYGEHLKVLDTVERYCNSQGISQRVFKDIRDKYTKDTDKIISDIIKKALVEGVDSVISIIKPIKIIKTILGTIETIGENAGADASAKAKYALNVYGYKVSEYKDGLTTAINNLKTCKKGTEEWDKYANDVKNMFSFFKTSLTDCYHKMSSAVTGKKKAYYDYVASLIDKLTLKNFNEITIPTYKQYLNM